MFKAAFSLALLICCKSALAETTWVLGSYQRLSATNTDNWLLEWHAPSTTTLRRDDSPPSKAEIQRLLTPQPTGTAPADVVVVSSNPEKESSTKSRKKSNFVPPGFEDLLEPQTTLVDVYYGGAYITSSSATFTPTYITFLSPAEVVMKVPDVLEPDLVEKVLATEMPTNTAFACIKSNQSDCGKVETDNVDVIFDEGRFRVDLFIAPDLLAVRPASADKFLPPSSSGLSMLNVTSATVNGQEGSTSNYNIGNSTTIALKETRLVGVSNFTKTEDLTFDTLALQREINGQLTQAGIFRANAGNLLFLRQADFAGISIASSLNTRTDLDQSSGNDLQVFLDTRSRVDILKDGRLVSTATYETGNQILDTSQLPDGAYEIVIRIRDNAGGFSEETRFYVKTNRLPPLDQSLYFFDAGERVEKRADEILPRSTGEEFVRAGIARRITPNFGGEFGISATRQDHLLESGVFRLGRFYDARMNYALGSDDSHGASINARARIGVATLSTNARRTWTNDADSVLGPELTQATLNLTIPIGRATFNVTSRYNKRDTGTDKNLGLRLDFPTLNFGSQVFDTSIQYTENNDDTLVLITARLSFRHGRWQHQARTQYYEDRLEGDHNSNGFIGNLSSNWQDGDKYLSDISMTMRAVEERTDRTLESQFDYASDLGRANLEAVYSQQNERLGYGGSVFTSIIANADTLALGGKQQAQSAIVLDIDGQATDAYFDVLVNNSPKTNAKIGSRTIVGLAPYDTYHVELKPRGNSLVNFDNARRSATLYPGNVVTMGWKTTRVLVAFGQISDAKGSPIPNAVIDGVLGLATTDEFGFFQAEIESGTRAFRVRTRQSECEVTLPAFDTTELVVMLNELTCR
ncbi:MAG: CS1-pili formation C-terminal domain-containing protein [Pseudomonadales bacterium]